MPMGIAWILEMVDGSIVLRSPYCVKFRSNKDR